MKGLCWLCLVCCALGACLPADVCDPGQIYDGDSLCIPAPAPDGGPDGGLETDGGPDGGEPDGG